MKRRTLTSNILSLIKRNIPSICTVLILSSPEPRKGGSTVIYTHCPALLIGLLGWGPELVGVLGELPISFGSQSWPMVYKVQPSLRCDRKSQSTQQMPP